MPCLLETLPYNRTEITSHMSKPLFVFDSFVCTLFLTCRQRNTHAVLFTANAFERRLEDQFLPSEPESVERIFVVQLAARHMGKLGWNDGESCAARR